MFPLAGNEFPTHSAELAASIQGALADVFTLPGAAATVSVTGDFPAIGSLTLNLDGATLRSAHLPPKPVGAGQRKPGITVERLQISGHPIRHQEARLDLDLTATGLRFDFDRDSQGHPLLVLTDAQ